MSTTCASDTKGYYKALNIKPDTSAAGIFNAYQEAKLLFHPDSLAAYSLYSQAELKEIFATIEEAYQVLSDPNLRHAYDGHISPAYPPQEAVAHPPTAAEKPASPAETVPKKSKVHLISAATEISGELLKEIRESQHLTINDIASSTKISLQFLEAIEHEDTLNFPALFYMKSFLKQYAAAIGLDPQVVLDGYLPLHSSTADESRKP